jgi:hypothetical protein
MKSVLTGEDYKQYLEKKEHLLATRIRPDNVNLFDWLLPGDNDMRKTPEGRQLIEDLQALWQEKIVGAFFLDDPAHIIYAQELDKIITGALKECTTRESIEDTFKRYGIADTQDQIDKLNHAMGNPQTFFTPDDVSLEDTLELTIQMFLTMSWRVNEIYDKIGSFF